MPVIFILSVFVITGSDSISVCTVCGYHKGLCRICTGQKGHLGHKSGYAVSVAEYEGGRNEISATIYTDFVYFISGRILKICIADTDSGKYIQIGHFVYRAVDRTDQTGAGKGRGEVPDRDHACYVHSGGCWADGVLGIVDTVCTACLWHYCYLDRDGHGSNRNLFTMGDPERKKAGRGRST